MAKTPTVAYQVNNTSGRQSRPRRRILTWKFGFADPYALRYGLKGAACRGEEHAVVLVWDVRSGKFAVHVDDVPVYETPASERTDVPFDHFFHMPERVSDERHTMKVSGSRTKGIVLGSKSVARRFDLAVDGQSFFEMRKIYQLGMSQEEVDALEEEEERATEQEEWAMEVEEDSVGAADELGGVGGVLLYEEGGPFGMQLRSGAGAEEEAVRGCDSDPVGKDEMAEWKEQWLIEHAQQLSLLESRRMWEGDATTKIILLVVYFFLVFVLDRIKIAMYPGSGSYPTVLHFTLQVAFIFVILRFAQVQITEEKEGLGGLSQSKSDRCIVRFS